MLNTTNLPEANNNMSTSSDEHFEKLLKESQSAPTTNTWSELGKCYLNVYSKEYNPNEGFKCVKNALELDQNNFDALHYLANCYACAEGTEQDLDKALACAQKATDLDSKNHQAWFGLVSFYSGIIGQDNPELALKCYQKAIDANGSIPLYWASLGSFYHFSKPPFYNPDLAFQSYKKAIELDGNYALAWSSLRICYCHGIGTTPNLKNFLDCQENIDRIRGNQFNKEDHELEFNLHNETELPAEEEFNDRAEPLLVSFPLSKDPKPAPKEKTTSTKKLKKK